jgi:hypothetical protein
MMVTDHKKNGDSSAELKRVVFQIQNAWFAEHPRMRSDEGLTAPPVDGDSKPSGIRQWQEVTKLPSMAIAFWRAAASCC